MVLLAAGSIRVICAWCEAEGLLTVLRAGTGPTSHGICPRHERAFVAQIEDRAVAGVAVEAGR